MPVYEFTFAKGADTKTFLMGSVHLTPDDPHRGEQLNKVADWMIANQSANAIVMGDFNWGYKRAPNVENYLGEKRVLALHEAGEIYQLFHPISYLGKGKAENYRTNLGFRKVGQFYDQFLTTPSVATMLADGGKIRKDFGFVSITQTKHYKDNVKFWAKRATKGMEAFIKAAGIADTEMLDAREKAKVTIEKAAMNFTTFIVSDHKPVWMQVNLW